MKMNIKEVWHNGKEVPENGSHILMLVHTCDRTVGDVTFFEDRTVLVNDDEDWKSFREVCHVLQWCYVKDIFYDKTMEE